MGWTCAGYRFRRVGMSAKRYMDTKYCSVYVLLLGMSTNTDYFVQPSHIDSDIQDSIISVYRSGTTDEVPMRVA
jgi:hypothetical protein